MCRLFIMRGLPGTGKTTFAKTTFRKGTPIFSADSYFTGPTGWYMYDPAKVPAAHASCLRNTLAALIRIKGENSVVVVDNTNTMVWEFAAYVSLGQAYGWQVQIVQMPVPASLHELAERNVHSIPYERIQKMHERFEPVPPPWRILEVAPGDVKP